MMVKSESGKNTAVKFGDVKYQYMGVKMLLGLTIVTKVTLPALPMKRGKMAKFMIISPLLGPC